MKALLVLNFILYATLYVEGELQKEIRNSSSDCCFQELEWRFVFLLFSGVKIFVLVSIVGAALSTCILPILLHGEHGDEDEGSDADTIKEDSDSEQEKNANSDADTIKEDSDAEQEEKNADSDADIIKEDSDSNETLEDSDLDYQTLIDQEHEYVMKMQKKYWDEIDFDARENE